MKGLEPDVTTLKTLPTHKYYAVHRLTQTKFPRTSLTRLLKKCIWLIINTRKLGEKGSENMKYCCFFLHNL